MNDLNINVLNLSLLISFYNIKILLRHLEHRLFIRIF